MASTYDQDSYKTNAKTTPYYLLSVVTKNKELYTHTDIEGSGISRRYQRLLGLPATIAFLDYVINNILINFSITVDAVNRSDCIYGEATPILHVKIIRKKPTVHLKRKKLPQPLQM